VWEHSLEGGLRMLRLAIDTHIITSHFALPLLIKNPGGLIVEMTDGNGRMVSTSISEIRPINQGSLKRSQLWGPARPRQPTASA
jgi:hypothetical protein